MTHRLTAAVVAALLLLMGCDRLPSFSEPEPEITDTMDLRQTWQVTLVSSDTIPDSIPPSPTFLSVIDLPGTLDDVGLGERITHDSSLSVANLAHLQRERAFVGRAWYQLAINIPDHFKGQRAVLTLERALWRTQLWVNGERLGEQISLSTPHRYVIERLDTLKRGLHVLSLLVDNRDQIPGLHARDTAYFPPSQTLTGAYTEHAQVKWNGILGEVSLRLAPDLGVRDLQVFPEPDSLRLRLRARPRQLAPQAPWQVALLDLRADTVLRQVRVQPSMPNSTGEATAYLPMPADWPRWHPRDPQRFGLRVWPADSSQGQGDSLIFGYRSLRRQGSQVYVNDQPVFLRGVPDHGLFARTGHPPTDPSSWVERLQPVLAYGFNLVQFVGWCPPEAAFHVADSLGLYLGVSLPVSRAEVAQDSAALVYLRAEGQRIQRAFGHHPSLLLLAAGTRDDSLLAALRRDGRQLLLEDSLALPTVGGYRMFPPLAELDGYDGVLQPIPLRNLRLALERGGLLAQAAAMQQASGQWALTCALEELRVARLRPGLSGFLWDQWRDYPGQGGHWRGLWQANGQAKGLMDPEELARYQTPLAALVSLPQRVYRSDERLRAEVSVANFLAARDTATLRWSAQTAAGVALGAGEIGLDTLPLGLGANVGTIALELDTVQQATAATLTLEVAESRQAWAFWVFPAAAPQALPDSVVFTTSRRVAETALAEGKRVLWQVTDARMTATGPLGARPWQGGSLWADSTTVPLGLQMDPSHPALAGFPTEAHADWQWAELLTAAFSLDLTETEATPVVSVIDHARLHRRLAVVAEAQRGPGRLLFTSLNLSDNLRERPAALALRKVLLRYLAQ